MPTKEQIADRIKRSFMGGSGGGASALGNALTSRGGGRFSPSTMTPAEIEQIERVRGPRAGQMGAQTLRLQEALGITGPADVRDSQLSAANQAYALQQQQATGALENALASRGVSRGQAAISGQGGVLAQFGAARAGTEADINRDFAAQQERFQNQQLATAMGLGQMGQEAQRFNAGSFNTRALNQAGFDQGASQFNAGAQNQFGMAGLQNEFARSQQEEQARIDDIARAQQADIYLTMWGAQQEHDAQQRKRDRWADIGGGLIQAGGAAGAALLMCWVADELFGVDDQRTHDARLWANTHDNWFLRLYGKHGRAWASWLSRNRWAKPIVRPIWDFMAFAGAAQRREVQKCRL